MKRAGRRVNAGVLVVGLLLLFPSSAHAYLDPGSGSLILQTLVAAFFAISLVLRVFWKRIKTFVLHLVRGEREANEEE